MLRRNNRVYVSGNVGITELTWWAVNMGLPVGQTKKIPQPYCAENRTLTGKKGAAKKFPSIPVGRRSWGSAVLCSFDRSWVWSFLGPLVKLANWDPRAPSESEGRVPIVSWNPLRDGGHFHVPPTTDVPRDLSLRGGASAPPLQN